MALSLSETQYSKFGSLGISVLKGYEEKTAFFKSKLLKNLDSTKSFEVGLWIEQHNNVTQY